MPYFSPTLVPSNLPVLDEPSERGQPCTRAHHDHRADGTVGQSEAGVSDEDGNVDHWTT